MNSQDKSKTIQYQHGGSAGGVSRVSVGELSETLEPWHVAFLGRMTRELLGRDGPGEPNASVGCYLPNAEIVGLFDLGFHRCDRWTERSKLLRRRTEHALSWWSPGSELRFEVLVRAAWSSGRFAMFSTRLDEPRFAALVRGALQELGGREMPATILLDSVETIVVPWFHGLWVDVFSSVHSPAQIVDILNHSARAEPTLAVVEVRDRF